MRTSPRRRVGVIGLVALTTLAGVGCDVVKVGAKCRAGAAPGRDDSHLVLCQNGRWTRSITLQETANILVGLLPAKAEVVGGNSQTTEAGGFFAKDFQIKVTRGDGRPSVGTQVDLIVPKAGASLDRGPRSLKTDENGVAAFLATANTVAGTYEVTAKVADRDVSTKLTFTNTPAAAKNVSLWSGANQSAIAGTDYPAPVVLKVTDTFGNAVPGVTPTVTSPNVMLAGQPTTGSFTTPAPTGADGLTSFTVKAPVTAGDTAATFTAVASAAAVASGTTFSLKVKPDVPASVDIAVANGTQSAAVSTTFALPLSVAVLDQYTNPIPGLTVTYTVVPVGGAGATLSAATATTSAQGVASVTAAANATAGSYTVQVGVQGFAPQSSIEFDLTNTP